MHWLRCDSYDTTFYKERWINEDGLEQRLIVTYSLKYRDYERSIRDRQVERAVQMLDTPSSIKKKQPNDPKRFIARDYCTMHGEVAEKTVTYLDEEQIANEERFDGLYAVCTNLEDDVSTILKVNQRRWEIEECFRIMKSELRARPVYLSRRDRITAHFTTCFTALVIYRILEKKLEGKYTCEEILTTLKKMNMLVSEGDGYIPAYTRTDLTDHLHEAFRFRTDYQIISQRNMKKICTKTKK
ncbi:MAG: transposase [Lachnospiraceae bacterium]|nr:transposase [Lachnospiraceae bacterium]